MNPKHLIAFLAFFLFIGVTGTSIAQSEVWASFINRLGVSISKENLSLVIFIIIAMIGIAIPPIFMSKNENADDVLDIAGEGVIGSIIWILIGIFILSALYVIGYYFGVGFDAGTHS